MILNLPARQAFLIRYAATGHRPPRCAQAAGHRMLSPAWNGRTTALEANTREKDASTRVGPASALGRRPAQRQIPLARFPSPAAGFAHGSEREAVERRGSVQAQGLEMVGSAVTLVAAKIVLRVGSVQLFDQRVPRHFGQNGR